MSGTGGPGMEQGRRLLVWFDANYKKLAVALGGAPGPGAAADCCALGSGGTADAHTPPLVVSAGVWLAAAGAAAFKATSDTQPQPDALAAGQQQQPPSADQLAALLDQQEAAAREQMRRETRWEQEERQEQDIRRDEDRDWGR